MSQVMEDVVHGLLKGGANIFKAEGKYMIGKCAPWGSKGCFVLIGMSYMNLVIA